MVVMKLKLKLLALILAAALLLPGCAPQEQAEIAATTLPVYQFTSRLCQGTDISVIRLVNESISCLHDYSLNVSQVKALEAAKVTVISGAGLEESMDELIAQSDQIIDCSVGTSLIHCHDHDAEQDHGHHHEADAHIWLSPEVARSMVEQIYQGLCQYYPEQQSIFQENRTALLQELILLEEYGEQQLSDLSSRKLLTFHDGFAYFAQAFDLEIVHAIEEESGSEASAQELKDMIGIVREHQLPGIFTEKSGSVSAAGIIARETGAQVYTLDMAMAGADYFQAMYHNIDTIKEALG